MYCLNPTCSILAVLQFLMNLHLEAAPFLVHTLIDLRSLRIVFAHLNCPAIIIHRAIADRLMMMAENATSISGLKRRDHLDLFSAFFGFDSFWLDAIWLDSFWLDSFGGGASSFFLLKAVPSEFFNCV